MSGDARGQWTENRGQGSGTGGQGPDTTTLPFSFVEAPDEVRDESAVVVRIPAGVRSKQKLLAILADKLQFPGYFGWNWDALEELLQDLSWLPEGRPVLMVHEDLPFGAGGEHRGTYLSILAGLANHAGGRSVRAIFPADARGQIGAERRELRQPS
jgi:hypothetical protein